MAKNKSWKKVARMQAVEKGNKLPRKLLRKQAKLMSKERRQNQFNKKQTEPTTDQGAKVQVAKKLPESVHYTSKSEQQIKPKASQKRKSKVVRQRNAEKIARAENREANSHKMKRKKMGSASMDEELNKDEATIKYLTKKLFIHKFKNNNLPGAFKYDGLDYLLEACDIIESSAEHRSEFDNEPEFDDDGPEQLDSFAQSLNRYGKHEESSEEREKINVPRSSPMEAEGEPSAVDVETSGKRVRFNLPEASPAESEGEHSEGEHTDPEDDGRKEQGTSAQARHDEEQGSSEDELEPSFFAEEEPEMDGKHSDVSTSSREAGLKRNYERSRGSDTGLDQPNKKPKMIAGEDDELRGNDNGQPPKSEVIKKTPREDIYGRFLDDDGAVVKEDKPYVPPALREKLTDTSETSERLRRFLKGLLNRLSESNFHKIANEIESSYACHSRNELNETLYELIYEAVVQFAETPQTLIQNHAMLIALLHAHVGSEVGAHFLESLAKKLDSLFKFGGNYGKGKYCNNLLSFLLQLYCLRVVDSKLIYDIWQILVDSFQEKDVELILLTLRCAGFVLRKDDPMALKNTILNMQKKAAAYESDTDDKNRVKFMMETLVAIRNNNMHKIPQYDPQKLERYRKLLESRIRKGRIVEELHVSLSDLLDTEKKGRWWVIGSAWIGDTPGIVTASSAEGESTPALDGVSKEILELAKQQRMTTDSRKQIFCIIMTAEDYIDAYVKLARISLKNNLLQRDVMSILIDCCLQELTFNRFYSYLIEKMCSSRKNCMVAVKCSVSDRIKSIKTATPNQISNLSKLLGFLFLRKAISISVLKVIEFVQIDKATVRLLKQLFSEVLLHEEKNERKAVFEPILRKDDDELHSMFEGIRLFFEVFMTKPFKNASPDMSQKLENRIKGIKEYFSKSDAKTKL